MNMVEFYQKMNTLLNPQINTNNSKKVTDDSSVTVKQNTSYSTVRPNADTAAINYANKMTDSEYEEYVYVEITDEENQVYQAAINAGMEEAVEPNRSALSKQMTIVVDQYMEYICNLGLDANSSPIDANKISRILNLLSGSVGDFTKEYAENNKDNSAFIMADVTKEFIKFAEKKINEYAEQMQISEQNINGLKDLESNNLNDLKEIFNTVSENGYVTQQEAQTAREAATDYVLAAMLNGTEDISVLKLLDPKYTSNINYLNAQKYIKEAERYEKVGDFINAEKSYGKAYDAIAKIMAKASITDLTSAVNNAGESNTAEESSDNDSAVNNNKPNNTTGTNNTTNKYEQTIESLTNQIKELKNIIKTLFEKIAGLDKEPDKTEEAEDPETDPTMENIKANIEALKNLPSAMSGFVKQLGTVFDQVLNASTVAEAEEAYQNALTVYNNIKRQLTEAEARLNKLEIIKERAEAMAESENATDTQKSIAVNAAYAYEAAKSMVDALEQTLATAEDLKNSASTNLNTLKTAENQTVSNNNTNNNSNTSPQVEPDPEPEDKTGQNPPTTPNTPNTPSNPSTPNTPTPSEPDTPVVPETPEKPDTPSVEEPSAPEAPKQPTKATGAEYSAAFDIYQIVNRGELSYNYVLSKEKMITGLNRDQAKEKFSSHAGSTIDSLAPSIKKMLQDKLGDKYDASFVEAAISYAKEEVINSYTSNLHLVAPSEGNLIGDKHTIVYDTESREYAYNVSNMKHDFLELVQNYFSNN